MLVEMTWPRGRSLREYTVLLDPPVLLPGPAVPQAVQPAQTRPATRPPAAARSIVPRRRRTAAPAPQPRAAPPRASRLAAATSGRPRRHRCPRVPASTPGGTYGPVQRAETLWAIAERFRPQGVTMNQMLVAVYRGESAGVRGQHESACRSAPFCGFRKPSICERSAPLRPTPRCRGRSTSGKAGRRSRHAATRPADGARAGAAGRPSGCSFARERASPTTGSSLQRIGRPRMRRRSGPRGCRRGNRERSPLARGSRRAAAESAEPGQRRRPNRPPSRQQPAEAEVAAPGVDLESEQLFSDEAQAPEAAVAAESPAHGSGRSARHRRRGRTVADVAGPRLGDDAVAVDRTRSRRLAAAALCGSFGVAAKSPKTLPVAGKRSSRRSMTMRFARRPSGMRRKVPDESFVVEEQPSRPRRAEPSLEEAPQPCAARRAPRRRHRRTKRCRVKPSSISTRRTQLPKPISTWRTASTIRPPSSFRRRSKPRRIAGI